MFSTDVYKIVLGFLYSVYSWFELSKRMILGHSVKFIMNAKVFTRSIPLLVLSFTKIKTLQSGVFIDIKRSVRSVSFLFNNGVALVVFSFIGPIEDMIFDSLIVQF